MLFISQLYVHTFIRLSTAIQTLLLSYIFYALYILCIIYILDYTSFTDSDRESNGEKKGTDCFEWTAIEFSMLF